MAPVNAATLLFDVPPSVMEAVCAIVDSGRLSWRALASRLLSTWHEMRLVERLEAAGGSPTREILWLWAQRCATVGDLQRELEAVGHRHAARLLSARGESSGRRSPSEQQPAQAQCTLEPGPAVQEATSCPPGKGPSITADSGRHPVVTYEDVLEGTGNFHASLKIGGRSQSEVYKGTKGDLTFAVKVFKKENKASWRKLWNRFRTELQVLQLYQHPNVLELWGCFSESDRFYLIYPYLDNGSLSHRLHSQDAGLPLTWQVRQDVINGVAKAIHFLHTAQPCSVVCANITSANILLDRCLQPKLSELGVAHLRPHSLDQSGTIVVESGCHSTLGYLPQEYIRDGKLSTKVDVYSLGVVIMEVLTGQRVTDKNRKHPQLTDLLQEAVEDSGSLDECLQNLDPSAGCWPHSAALGLLRLALECTATQPKNRPNTHSMLQVLHEVYPLPCSPEDQAHSLDTMPAPQANLVTSSSLPIEDDETQSVPPPCPCECSQSEILYRDGGDSSPAPQSSSSEQMPADLYSSWPVQCSCAAEAQGHQCEDCVANGFTSAEPSQPQGDAASPLDAQAVAENPAKAQMREKIQQYNRGLINTRELLSM